MEARSRRRSRRRSTPSRASRAALDHGPRHEHRDRHLRRSSRDVDCAAQDVRDRVLSVAAQPAARHPAADHHQAGQRLGAGAHAGRLRQPRRPRVDGARRRDGKVQLERALGVGEVRVIGGQERAIKVWLERRQAGRLSASRSRAVRDAITRQNEDLPGGNVTAGRAGADAAHDGAGGRSARSSTTWWWPTINGAPIRVRDIGARRGRHQGAALAGAAGRRAHRHHRGAAAVGREHGGHDRGGQGDPRARRAGSCRPTCKLEMVRDQSRYIHAALHEINLHLMLGSILA